MEPLVDGRAQTHVDVLSPLWTTLEQECPFGVELFERISARPDRQFEARLDAAIRVEGARGASFLL